ncbi:hypothetical protein ACE41H_06365 [Paenibacillus enshidis]|uniref:Uncharacterized protein n=1 Tax=Paenibacillus enshidis TaxID=1458439 RepID=A0ABV5ASL4_9BACL
MSSDEVLDVYRVSGEKVRVIRDGLKENDVVGIVLAWDDEHLLIRRPNRRVVKLSRNYTVQPFKEPRPDILEMVQDDTTNQDRTKQ